MRKAMALSAARIPSARRHPLPLRPEQVGRPVVALAGATFHAGGDDGVADRLRRVRAGHVVVVRPSCSTKVVEITASLEGSLERVSDTLLMRDLAIRRLVNH
jgi:hypothetical protein